MDKKEKVLEIIFKATAGICILTFAYITLCSVDMLLASLSNGEFAPWNLFTIFEGVI